jgi:hypothetical protein
MSIVMVDHLMTESEFKQKDIGPGDDVVYVGRFMYQRGTIRKHALGSFWEYIDEPQR